MRLTLGIVGKTLFDEDVESEASEIRQIPHQRECSSSRRITNPFAGLLDKLPLPSNVRWLKAKQRLDSTIYRIIDEHRASGS